MDGRHRFILQRLKDGFNIARVTVIEQFLSQEKVLSQINDFFRGDGIPTLIFLYQPARSGLEDDGESQHIHIDASSNHGRGVKPRATLIDAQT